MCVYATHTVSSFIKESSVDFTSEVSLPWLQLPGEWIQPFCEKQYLFLNKYFSDTFALANMWFHDLCKRGKKIAISSNPLIPNETEIWNHLFFILSDNRYSQVLFRHLLQFSHLIWLISPQFSTPYLPLGLWEERKNWDYTNPTLLWASNVKGKQMNKAKNTARKGSWLLWNHQQLQQTLSQHGFSNDQWVFWDVLPWARVNTEIHLESAAQMATDTLAQHNSPCIAAAMQWLCIFNWPLISFYSFPKH